MLKSRSKSRYVGVGITLLVLMLLVFAGPAKAFELSLTGFGVSDVEKGGSVSTTATININSNERVSVGSVDLELANGDSSRTCSFDVNGNPLGGCDGITVELISSPSDFGYGYGYAFGYGYNYGYGYGHSNGELVYEITLNTTDFSPGDYEVSLSTNLGGHDYSSDTETLTVSEVVTGNVDFTANVSSAVGNNISVGGVAKTLDSFTSGSLTNVDLSVAKQIGNQQVLISKAVQITTPVTLKNNAIPNIKVSIPANTVILAPTGWNGIVNPPATVAASGSAPSGFSLGSTIIEVGSPDAVLIFDTPVTLTLEGVSGDVGYKPSGSDAWVQITEVCAGTYSNPTSPTFPGECAITDGTDTKIVTYHFTSFGSFETSSGDGTTGTGGSVGSGGSCSTQWSCTEWTTCSADGTQTRTCSYPANFCVPRSEKPVEVQLCDISATAQPGEEAGVDGRGAPITGAFIGTLGTGGIVVIVLVVVFIIGTVVFLRKKK